MRKFFSSLLILAALMPLTKAVYSQGGSLLQVYILAGQSNMVGLGTVVPTEDHLFKNGGKGTLDYWVENDTDSFFAHLKNTDGSYKVLDDAWIYYLRSGNEIKGGVTTGYGGSNDVIGPEFEFGHVMAGFHDEQVLLIKVAAGGRSLGEDFRPPSAVSPSGYTTMPTADRDTGYHFMQVVTITRDVIANLSTYFPGYDGNGYEIKGFGWHQGWNDRVDAARVAEYESNMVTFIKDMRDSLGVANLPFVIACSGMASGWDQEGNALTLIEAQMAPSDDSNYPEFAGNVGYVEARDYWRIGEDSPSDQGFHWNNNAESYFLLGHGLAEEMTQLLYNEAPYSPRVIRPPEAASVSPGNTAEFRVYALGSALTYQWQRDGANIAGATAATYTTPATDMTYNGAQYRVVITNGAGSINSTSVALTVNPAAPAVTTQPAAVTVDERLTAEFSVIATGASLTYQWQKDGVDIAGAVKSTYITPETSPPENGSKYRVIITNTAGTVTSNEAVLTVTQLAPQLLEPQTSDFTGPAGGGATFHVTVLASEPTYQWQKDGVDIAGANGRIFTYIAQAGDDGAKFRCQVTNGAGSVTGREATLTLCSGECTGHITREWWLDVRGKTVAELTGDPDFPHNPTGIAQLTSFDAPAFGTDNYGTRIHGYIHPPTTGEYTFWTAADDVAELWLSTSEDTSDISQICEAPYWTGHYQWDKSGQQESDPISLQGGSKYYVRVLHKEGNGGDAVAVAWQGPGIDQAVIDGQYLSPYLYSESPVVKSQGWPEIKIAAMEAAPNPFSHTLNIHFDLPLTSGQGLNRVRVSLYSLTGQPLAVITDRYYKPGRHAMMYRITGETLKPGIYFLRLQSGSFTHQVKVVKIK